MKKERVIHLLKRTIKAIEEEYGLSIFECDWEEMIGITREEYNELFY